MCVYVTLLTEAIIYYYVTQVKYTKRYCESNIAPTQFYTEKLRIIDFHIDPFFHFQPICICAYDTHIHIYLKTQ